MSAVAAAVAKPIAPASPFAELLRRSRFASYDPAIRQTYSSPPAHAHRGDWGLKRPLRLRRRNGFITVSSFEHHAHFADWTPSPHEVMFVRRIEEMGARTVVSETAPWSKMLGNARTIWPQDSEFCPGCREQPLQKSVPPELDQMGKRGSGQQPEGTQLIPNVSAMSEQQFKRYLQKLHALRPKFKEYLKRRNDKSIYELCKEGVNTQHLKFLSDQTAQEYCDPNTRKFKDQPHPNAGLMYSRPTPLGALLTTETQPGLVLRTSDNRKTNSSRFTGVREGYLAGFGGLVANVDKEHSGSKTGLFDSEYSIDKAVEKSFGYMRTDQIKVHRPPRVVGCRTTGLDSVTVESHAIVQADHHMFAVENDNEPGTPEYVGAQPVSDTPSYFEEPWSASSEPWHYSGTKTRNDTRQTINVLQSMAKLHAMQREDKKEGA